MQIVKRFICNHIAILIITISSIIVACGFGFFYCNLSEYWRGIGVEAAGTCWDILLVVVLLGFYDTHRRKREKIKELQRRIDDFKKLKNEYGNTMIGASLRQLAELGETAINFTGIELDDFSFSSDHGVFSIANSRFSEGLPLRRVRHWGSKLNRVEFHAVDCSNVVFGDGNLAQTSLLDCSFGGAVLCGAKFESVFISASEDFTIVNRGDWMEAIGEENGEPFYVKTYSPMFEEADLKGANFKNAELKNLDFRGAINILEADFTGAKFLDTCFFDEGVREKLSVSCP